jgi:hypothetical protein
MCIDMMSAHKARLHPGIVRIKAELATIDVELAGVEAQERTLTDHETRVTIKVVCQKNKKKNVYFSFPFEKGFCILDYHIHNSAQR